MMDRNRRMLILGNGPSTQAIVSLGLGNLKSDVDTFGMGAAYRYFRMVDWWPTYYALGDQKVVFSHRTEFAQLVTDPEIGVERFYLSLPVAESDRLEVIDHCSTGDFCYTESIALGYREIFLIGIEGDYVEDLPESRPMTDTEYRSLGFDELNLSDDHRETLRIFRSTPESNPNYFFDGYQVAGDVYSLPRSQRHRQRWTDAASAVDRGTDLVLNLSPTSKVRDFPKVSLEHGLPMVVDSPNVVPLEPAAPDGRSGDRPEFWFGPFDREDKKRIDESNVIFDLFSSPEGPNASGDGVMVDVGACRGGAFRPFARDGWDVHAFEPNPELVDDLRQRFDLPNVTISDRAVSDIDDSTVSFYTSEESLGISTLAPFHESHNATATVTTITLDRYLREAGVSGVDFLKIDTEGFDLMVLKGLDLASSDIEVVLCEFEDAKTVPLGYTLHDLGNLLVDAGYAVYMSEWHPVVKYGGDHQWRMLKSYPCEPEGEAAWGNLLAFREDPGIWAITKAFKRNAAEYDERRQAKQERLQQQSEGELDEAREKIAFLEGRVTALEELNAANKEIKRLERRVSSLENSTSWRVTRPVRSVGDAIKRYRATRGTSRSNESQGTNP